MLATRISSLRLTGRDARPSMLFDGASQFTASDHGGETVVDDKTIGSMPPVVKIASYSQMVQIDPNPSPAVESRQEKKLAKKPDAAGEDSPMQKK
jgi:hypothetical protein